MKWIALCASKHDYSLVFSSVLMICFMWLKHAFFRFYYTLSKHTTSFWRPYNIHNVKTTSYGCQNNVVSVPGSLRFAGMDLELKHSNTEESVLYYIGKSHNDLKLLHLMILPYIYIRAWVDYSIYFFFFPFLTVPLTWSAGLWFLKCHFILYYIIIYRNLRAQLIDS